MVSSSVDGEGKTTLAVNLALSLASLGMRTVLVEGDLRNPEMSRSLCPRARIGAIEVATNRAGFDKALLVDRATGLAVLPSPSSQRTLANNEFVFSEAMSNILDRLRQHFDYVIINSPPLIPLVDARALAEIVDRVVLTIRWDSTPQDVVAQAFGTLALAYDRVLGTVLTRVDMQRLRILRLLPKLLLPLAVLLPWSATGGAHVMMRRNIDRVIVKAPIRRSDDFVCGHKGWRSAARGVC